MRQNNQTIEDRLLLKKACHKACGQSISILYRKYRKPVCDFLHKAGADGLTEDICQAVFIQILAGKCNYDGTSNVKSYLFGIARNIHNQERISKNKKNIGRNQIKVAGDLLIDRSAQLCPSEFLETSEILQIIRQKAEKLPLKARQAVELVYLEEIPAKKAAKIAKCNFSTFRTRLNYGLRRLLESTKKTST